MTRGVRCEHSHKDRIPSGRCRVCAKESRNRTIAKRGPLTACDNGHVGQWYTNGRCKTCNKILYAKRRTNPDAVEKMRTSIQKYSRFVRGQPDPTYSPASCCECCGRPFGKKGPCLDHCHKSGIFRGWICTECNLGIGKLGDDVEGVKKALDYLNRSYSIGQELETCALQPQSLAQA